MSNPIQRKRNRLVALLREVSDLESAASVLSWDQMTYMPPQGAEARGRQIAVLEELAHKKAIRPAIGRLLDELQPWAETLPYDDDDAALIRVARREYEIASRIPPSFSSQFAEHSAHSYDVWTTARPTNNFDITRENLKTTLDFSHRYADFFPGYAHPADPHIDAHDHGMTVSTIRPLFEELRVRLTALVEKILAQPPIDDSFLNRHYPEARQRSFGEQVIRDYGYDFQSGRQDKTLHPFATRFSAGDVRITTRFNEYNLPDGLFSTLHESGHAMYEQGIDPGLDAGPLGHGTSSGVHESQSRSWENLVGRSLGFWQHYYPMLQDAFPSTLDDVSLDSFYRAINKVERSLIRVEADEVTYNLHVIIRFGLECDMLEGKLDIRDLPEAWNAAYQRALGVSSPTHTNGVLQDVHWFGHFIGGVFQGYTLGNILSAQFFETALKAHPDIPSQIEQGNFSTLHAWLTSNIYRHGSKFTTAELVQRVTGGPLSIEPYMRYLTTKYGEIYKL